MTPRFSKQNVGHNMLKVYMKRMFNLSVIETSTRFITNHSRKVTLCTTLFNYWFDNQMVRQRSGHRSTAMIVTRVQGIVTRVQGIVCYTLLVIAYNPPNQNIVHRISQKSNKPDFCSGLKGRRLLKAPAKGGS